MNCPECLDLLHKRLDGEVVPRSGGLEQHLAQCAECRERHAAAALLEEGLRALPRPVPPAELTPRIVTAVLAQRRADQRWRRRVWVSAAVAAGVLLAVFSVYQWVRTLEPSPQAQPQTVQPSPQPAPAPVPSLQQHVKDAGTAVVTWKDRLTDQTLAQAKRFAPVLEMPPMAGLPTVGDLEQPFDPAAQSLRQAGQGVSTGLGTVTGSARQAVAYFLREISSKAPERKPGL
jgi:hypothetical protein